jgi:hypothetical protein
VGRPVSRPRGFSEKSTGRFRLRCCGLRIWWACPHLVSLRRACPGWLQFVKRQSFAVDVGGFRLSLATEASTSDNLTMSHKCLTPVAVVAVFDRPTTIALAWHRAGKGGEGRPVIVDDQLEPSPEYAARGRRNPLTGGSSALYVGGGTREAWLRSCSDRAGGGRAEKGSLGQHYASVEMKGMPQGEPEGAACASTPPG